MSKQTIEVELLDTSREQPGVQQRQSARWPYEVIDPLKCEFQYRAFSAAYTRVCRDTDSADRGLADAELRLRWLDYYVCYRDPSQAQIESFARSAVFGWSPLSRMSTNDRSFLYAVIAFVLSAAILFH